MALIIVLILAAGVVACLVIGHNRLIRMGNQCEEAFSTMDVYLKKRADLVPNLVSAVRGYADHEARTLAAMVAQRAEASDPKARLDSESRLGRLLRQVLATAEGQPELRSNASFLDLQRQLGRAEEDIATARRYYNGCVKQYNDACMVFPMNLVASVFRFKPRTPFVATDADAADVKVDFR